jgi:hypothetical protein
MPTTILVSSAGGTTVSAASAGGTTVSVASGSANAVRIYHGATGSFADTFETVSKNLKAWSPTFAYSSGVLSTITYTHAAQTIVKTLNYTTGKLTSIVLSGDTPEGISLTKTLAYTGDDLTGIAYS